MTTMRYTAMRDSIPLVAVKSCHTESHDSFMCWGMFIAMRQDRTPGDECTEGHGMRTRMQKAVGRPPLSMNSEWALCSCSSCPRLLSHSSKARKTNWSSISIANTRTTFGCSSETMRAAISFCATSTNYTVKSSQLTDHAVL